MPAPKDLSGMKFGRLTAKNLLPHRKPPRKERVWACVCECGSAVHATTGSLTSGNTKSCGCLNLDSIRERNTRHSDYRSLTYNSWAGMVERCTNPNHKSFWKYGEKGVKVCERWRDYRLFMEDMGPRPSKEHSIDRIDYTGSYEPGNCRWATYLEQANNTPQNVNLTVLGETKSLAAWSRDFRCSICPQTIGKRLARGWDESAAVLAPAKMPYEHAQELASFISQECANDSSDRGGRSSLQQLSIAM